MFLISLTAWSYQLVLDNDELIRQKEKAKEIEVINIENPAVQAYMADSTYAYDNNFNTSVILKYKDFTRYGENLDWPNGKYVTWKNRTCQDSIATIRITVSEHKNFKDSVTHSPDLKTDTCFIIRNMIPNRTYYYKVEEILINKVRRRLTKGVFRTVGQVRMIQVRGSHNVRDLGGWPTQYGVPVKYGILYRSASLDVIKPEGRHDFAENLNVAAELDLRSEAKLVCSKLGEDKDYLLSPLQNTSKSITDRKDIFAKNLRWLIERIKENKSVNWHCAIGCDRCGMMSFLIEGLLGLDEESLGRDYELSTLAWKKFPRPRTPIRGMINMVKKFGPEDDLAQCFYNYWLEAGMTKDELDYFLSTMLDLPM